MRALRMMQHCGMPSPLGSGVWPPKRPLAGDFAAAGPVRQNPDQDREPTLHPAFRRDHIPAARLAAADCGGRVRTGSLPIARFGLDRLLHVRCPRDARCSAAPHRRRQYGGRGASAGLCRSHRSGNAFAHHPARRRPARLRKELRTLAGAEGWRDSQAVRQHFSIRTHNTALANGPAPRGICKLQACHQSRARRRSAKVSSNCSNRVCRCARLNRQHPALRPGNWAMLDVLRKGDSSHNVGFRPSGQGDPAQELKRSALDGELAPARPHAAYHPDVR